MTGSARNTPVAAHFGRLARRQSPVNNSNSIRRCLECGKAISSKSQSGKCTRCSALQSARTRRLGALGFWERVDQSGGQDACWEWQGRRNSGGYGYVWRTTDDGLFTRAHRFAWYLTNGVIPDGLVVRHKCDNPSCCNPAHLETGTVADNNKDCKSRGRLSRLSGLDLRHTKVGPEDIAEMQRLRTSGVPRAEVARLFGLSESRVGHLAPVRKQKTTWEGRE